MNPLYFLECVDPKCGRRGVAIQARMRSDALFNIPSGSKPWTAVMSSYGLGHLHCCHCGIRKHYPCVDGETAVLGRCFVVLMTNVIFTPVIRGPSGRHDKATRSSWCWCWEDSNSGCNYDKPIPVWPWIRTCSRGRRAKRSGVWQTGEEEVKPLCGRHSITVATAFSLV